MRPRGEARSLVGRRERNEDSYCVEPDLGLFAVADGMGGHAGGDVASRLVIDSLVRVVRMAHRLDEDARGAGPMALARRTVEVGVRLARREVRRNASGVLADMGSTLAALLLRDDHALVAHVGDSRVYRLRDGELAALTRDHSLCCEIEDAGLVEIADSIRPAIRHVITRSITACGDDAWPSVRVEELQSGDRFLLCSDGVTDVLDDEDLRELMDGPPDRNAADVLAGLAFDRGSTDNITAIVVDVD